MAGLLPAGVAGLLLAAGEGLRYGQPKALVDTGSGPWVSNALAVMAGLDPLVVVTGAAAAGVEALLRPGELAVFNPDFRAGMGSSLAVGLARLRELDVPAAVIMLVDLPDVTSAVIDRVVAAVHPAGGGVAASVSQGRAAVDPTGGRRAALARATYHGVPGHPVLIGAEHFAEVIRTAGGDHGAREYLRRHQVIAVECGDLATGRDVDRPVMS